MSTRILLVDDHKGFRTAARRLLESEGWTVVGEAADGAAGIALATILRPDVVLLDIGLPDMDGFAVAASIAAAAGTAAPGVAGLGPAIVLVSSRDRGTYADRLGGSGALGFIAKGDLDGPALRALIESAVA